MMWYREPRWRSRLLAEQAVMRSRFPQFRLTRAEGDQLWWVGVLAPAHGFDFAVSVRYDAHFPFTAPALHVDAPRLHARTPHLYSDHSLCTHRKHWDPSTSTAASCVPLIADFLVHYLRWLRTGRWPS